LSHIALRLRHSAITTLIFITPYFIGRFQPHFFAITAVDIDALHAADGCRQLLSMILADYYCHYAD